MTRTIFGRLFEDTKIINKFPKRHICNTIEINTLFTNCNSKELRNFKVRPNHAVLKEMNADLWKVFFKFKCYDISYAELSEKVIVSRNTCP